MHLIFDTETTGFPSKSQPLFSPQQPHIAQLAAVLVHDDGEIISQVCLPIFPDGWEMNPRAEEVHGLSTDFLKSCGVPIQAAIAVLHNMAKYADHIIGHNLSYDLDMVRIEVARLGKEQNLTVNSHLFCTMKALTPICKLPSPRGSGYKWPRLQEAHKHCFGEEFASAHDALADVIATHKLHQWLLTHHPELVTPNVSEPSY